MALIECPECKKEISDQAVSCPHCGYPIRNKKENRPIAPMYLFWMMIASVVLLFINVLFIHGIMAYVILVINIAIDIFILYKSIMCIKGRYQRWGWCLATCIIGLQKFTYLFILLFFWIRSWIS